MKRRPHLLFSVVSLGVILATGLGCRGAETGTAPTPVKIIFDTDMLGDCDDCGALAILNKLADQGEAEILACVVNSRDNAKAVAASVSAINTYYHRPRIPIGTYQGTDQPAKSSTYTEQLRDEFPQQALADDKEPTALSVYRKALANAPDGSVTIVSVGYLYNLRDLLNSGPDAASPLAGADLVRAKVKKMVMMGGAFPKSPTPEFNLNMPVTKEVIDHWPSPILFSGFEIGNEIKTGKSLAHVPVIDPVRCAYAFSYQNCVRTGRPSWDLTAVLAAVRDPHLYWNVSDNGTCHVAPDNNDQWTADPAGHHTYLIRKMPPADVAKVLDQLMSLPPAQK